jgi:Glyoxalase/Bleomycin resistance protein/Dioxygenase superfamily
MTDQPIKCVATVFLPVTDQDRALAFFRDQLGFDVHSDTDYGEGIRWVEVVPPGSTTAIALSGPSDWSPGSRRATGPRSRSTPTTWTQPSPSCPSTVSSSTIPFACPRRPRRWPSSMTRRQQNAPHPARRVTQRMELYRQQERDCDRTTRRFEICSGRESQHRLGERPFPEPHRWLS